MKRTLLVFVSLLCSTSLAFSQTDTTLTAAQWEEDLQYLEQTLFKEHKNPVHNIPEEELKERFSSLRSRFSSLTSKQKLIELIMLMSSIGDGHTTIRSYDIFNYLPFHVYWFGDDLRVIWAKSAYADILGHKIRSIDGVDITAAKELVNTLSPKGENNYLLMQWGQQWFRNIDVLHYLGISKSDTAIELSLEDPDGELFTEKIPILSEDLSGQPWICAYKPLPLYMQNPAAPITYEALEGALYVNFRSYPSKKEMKAKVGELVNTLSSGKDLTKLIFDFRVNGGGDFTIGRLMIDRLKKSNVLKNREVYVITGRRTYSAAMVNALDLKKELGAMLLGEPPMQRPNGYSESHPFTLPHSNINASVSTEFYSFQNEDLDEVVLDKHFKPNFDLLKEGRDEILEWILQQ
ncbi:hypothetical protein ACT6NV_03290 [Robiginitalea sp. IMCC44478]|uniref:hypothetical protein n=1 Tax=Robiginitalea sp. IMCC44478 TaxID=3459122 RepID=UPI00404352CC